MLPLRKKRLNTLPANPESGCSPEKAVVGTGRFPTWLHRKLPKGGNIFKTGEVIAQNRLHTVCEEARCPNLLECWSKKTATFLAMGKQCTRSCGFCSIDFSEKPKPPEEDEPERIARSVQALGLKHVVLTMVARDDLSDGGAKHLKTIVEAIRKSSPKTTVELLTSDFAGNQDAWDVVLQARPEILNYNIETVRELTPRVRHKATYDRTLKLLKYMRNQGQMLIKSGLMVGLGETQEQVFQTLRDLQTAGCDIVTIGQYLQSASQKLLVKAFITPEQFQLYARFGEEIGISYVYAGPFVRSSYNAENVMLKMQKL
jgi:lipoic acid synthetase